ncbi:hypothetical protein Kisp01_27690 [Kineosporia sp. NBRC 101677]|uniref:DUF397 domain-containing protein n=1 Tax=Kineosporia sp. NBRC 101677 TaxID=3032197 RepID=UPI0024A36F5A|nr:DUF397 domain-containing protein [Kineosporia sp. NBRC 101677]GLY15754.1 hypothetical protein Kisp01_27690 [Kineosporia sp. NBRC 101677]
MITPWVKSTRSGSEGQCVEQRRNGAARQIRDSKNPSGAVLTVDADAYSDLLTAAKRGELDSLSS